MRSDGVIDGDTTQEITSKRAGMVAVTLRGGSLLNGGERVGWRGGPQLGQTLGAVILILSAEVLFLVRAALCFALARLRVFAPLGVLVVGARAVYWRMPPKVCGR